MTKLSDLKPTKKFLVRNLLADAGFDVSDWANYDGEHPASNPKYCYNWSFEQPGEMFAVCLWFSGLKKRGEEVYHTHVPKSRDNGTKFCVEQHLEISPFELSIMTHGDNFVELGPDIIIE